MKKLLLLLLCVPLIGLGQQTMIPDANFELKLINGGYDTILDGYVTTANIKDIEYLYIEGAGIYSLNGIQDFDSLKTLICNNNFLTSLDLSQNTAFRRLYCHNNNLSYLNLKNGNNHNFFYFQSCHNPDDGEIGISCYNNLQLSCILVDDSAWCSNNWYTDCMDSDHYFSNQCVTTGIKEYTTNKELLKVTDILGREVNEKRNTPLFYIYDDGTVEKKIIIE